MISVGPGREETGVLTEFYLVFGTVCFTLLGLWLVVVQTRRRPGLLLRGVTGPAGSGARRVPAGAERALRGGGPSLRYEVGNGDLLVMGGSCQRTWEHAIPKTARTAGPRISIQFRPRGVR